MLLTLLTKKKQAIKSRDYVMLKNKFKHSFPIVPTTVVLQVVDIDQNSATISFINGKGIILQEVLPIKCLYRVG